MKNPTWHKIYLEIKTSLEASINLNPRQRGWLNYQRIKRIPVTIEQENLLNELSSLMDNDWKTKDYRVKKGVKPKKREPIIGLGDRIKAARIKKGYNSINEFSAATKIAVSTIKDWENEISFPSCDRLVMLCNMLSVSADHLLFGKKTS